MVSAAIADQARPPRFVASPVCPASSLMRALLPRVRKAALCLACPRTLVRHGTKLGEKKVPPSERDGTAEKGALLEAQLQGRPFGVKARQGSRLSQLSRNTQAPRSARLGGLTRAVVEMS